MPAPSQNSNQEGDRNRRLLPSGKTRVIVDISDMRISANTNEELISYSLGSCIGVAIYDPALRIGGMIHCMLPLSKMDPEKSIVQPAMFVDTGMALLLKRLFNKGVSKSRAIVKVAGSAGLLDKKGFFKIGERNYEVVRRILWKNDLLIAGEDVLGELPRTIRLDIETGSFFVRKGGEEKEV